MAWIGTKQAMEFTGLSRKALIDLADAGKVRVLRENELGWRRYWRQDLEKLIVAKPQQAVPAGYGDPYDALKRAAGQMVTAANGVSEPDLDLLAQVIPTTIALWRVLRHIVYLMEDTI